MDHFRLSAAEFESLAAGYGDRHALAQLRAGQRAVRRLQLAAIAARSGELPVEVRERLEAAVALIEQAEVFEYPLLGAWATACLQRLAGTPGGVPVDIEFGYLGGVAAAAAARAGMEFEVVVPAWDGRVVLPTLGTVQLSGLVTVRGDADGITCTGDGPVVRVPRPYDVDVAGWRARRRVGPLALDDDDPYRACFGLPTTDRLDAETHARLAATTAGAIELIETRYERYAPGVHILLDSIVPLAGRSVSSASRLAGGAVAVALTDDPAELALLLIHEVQHMKLGALLDLVDLYVPDGTTLHHAPWRADPRPVGALLQGVYAHLGVADYWRTCGQAAGRYEFAYWAEQTRWAAATLATSGELTETGDRFVARLRETLDGWADEPVAPDVVAEVADSLTSAAVVWRLCNYEPVDVGTLAAAWRRGEPCGAVPPPTVVPGAAPGPARPPAGGPTTPAAGRDAVERTDDPAAWAALAVALRHAGHPAADAVTARPDLVRAVYRAVRPGAIDDVAEWLLPVLTAG
jgi:uncharacterized protein